MPSADNEQLPSYDALPSYVELVYGSHYEVSILTTLQKYLPSNFLATYLERATKAIDAETGAHWLECPSIIRFKEELRVPFAKIIILARMLKDSHDGSDRDLFNAGTVLSNVMMAYEIGLTYTQVLREEDAKEKFLDKTRQEIDFTISYLEKVIDDHPRGQGLTEGIKLGLTRPISRYLFETMIPVEYPVSLKDKNLHYQAIKLTLNDLFGEDYYSRVMKECINMKWRVVFGITFPISDHICDLGYQFW